MDANVLNFLIIFGAGVGANISSAAITAAAQKIFGSRPARVARVARVGRNSAAYSALRGPRYLTLNPRTIGPARVASRAD